MTGLASGCPRFSFRCYSLLVGVLTFTPGQWVSSLFVSVLLAFGGCPRFWFLAFVLAFARLYLLLLRVVGVLAFAYTRARLVPT